MSLSSGLAAGPTSNPIVWLNDPLNWQGDNGVPTHLLEHLRYSVVALAVAAVIALPLGLYIGHRNRLNFLVSGANALRSLPTVGILILLVVAISPHFTGSLFGYTLATEIALVLLALPAILSNTYAGVRNVDPAVRDAARGMGMTGSQVLFRVEVPNALPLIVSGVRSAALQVIATATIAAYVGLGGLGRFVYDGLSQRDFGQMIAGAILVALLAIVVDVLLALAQRYGVSRGVSGRFRTTTRRHEDAEQIADPAPDARQSELVEVTN